MAQGVPDRSPERTGRHDTLTALAAGTAVVALAGTIFLTAGNGYEQRNTPQPDAITVDDRRAPVVIELETANDPRWAEFLDEVARTVPEATARAAAEQACLNLRSNAGEGAAVDAVLAAGVSAEMAAWVVDASRRYICP